MRRNELIVKQANMIESPEHYLDVINKKDQKKLILRFLRNPVEFIPSESDPSRLGIVKMQRM